MITRDEILALPEGAAALEARDLDALSRIVPPKRIRVLVEIADIQAKLQSSGYWWLIKNALVDPEASAQTKQAAQTIIDVASARYVNVDMEIPLVSQMFGALMYVGLLSQKVHDEIVDLSWASVKYDRLEFEHLFT